MNTLEENIKIFTEKPADFAAETEVVACYFEVDDKLLMLKKKGGQYPNHWTVPAGKTESGEAPIAAVIREVQEETGIHLHESKIEKVGQLYICKSYVSFVYHLFHIARETAPPVVLSSEHCEYQWLHPQHIFHLPVITGAHDALSYYQQQIKRKNVPKATVSVYLILKKDDAVLLYLRHNTGYQDGNYGLIAGHVEKNEDAITALIREAYEEAGIHIFRENLNLVHLSHNKTNRINIDLFFECSQWKGEIINKEPHKCSDLSFFSPDYLPTNTIPYVAQVIQSSSQQLSYSEFGWNP
jgi:8-oxo-dGTP pyrophosphatase MutT (NUDIX family)